MNAAVTLTIKKYLSVVMMIIVTNLLTACQITSSSSPENSTAATDYSQYYLWLKSLTTAQVLSEETELKSLVNSEDKESKKDKDDSQAKLILIYSLSSTPLHQPYKAKHLLNVYLSENNKLSDTNLAFTTLLRDQLNTQLKLLKKQEVLQKRFKESDVTNNENTANIEELSKQLDQVKQQLILLKQIDHNINARN